MRQADGGQISFPAVPNRWLVTRTIGSQDPKQWVVESNYLYPPSQESEFSGVSYPCLVEGNPQPFRYMGRVVPLDLWSQSSQASAQYLDRLTAVGYGEPTFAAFYPNCHSVFGFYDNYNNQLPTDLKGVQYDVIGWYADPSQDGLSSPPFKDISDAKQYQKALKEHYQWVLSEPSDLIPQRTVCYARLTFNNVNPLDQSPSPEEKAIDVVVGNTSTEALSAYLAHRHIHSDPAMAGKSEADCRIACSKLEDQLEFLHLAPRLEGRTLDLGLKFLETRHEKEFTAVSGGTIWTIRPETSAPAPGATSSSDTANQEQVTLPLELAHLLNQLNIQQQAYDRDCDEIESMRKQLFADWYKYMLCAYPPQDRRDNYPDLDQVKYFIEKNSLLPLNSRLRRNNLLQRQCQQAVQALYKRVADLQLLRIEDVLDWTKFLAALKTSNLLALFKKDDIKAYLKSSDSVEEMASAIRKKPQKLQQIIEQLNTILIDGTQSTNGPKLYKLVFKSTTPEALTGEAQRLYRRLIQEEKEIATEPYHQVLRFRRLLLEGLLPGIASCPFFVLKPIPASRYWLPNEPVVLVTDKTVQPTERHGQDGRLRDDGLLECQINEINGEITTNFDFETIRTAIERINPHQSSRLVTGLNLSGKAELNQKKLPTDLKAFLKSSNVTDGEIDSSTVSTSSTVSGEVKFWLIKTGNREYRIWEEQDSLNVYQVKIGFYDWTEYPWHPFLLEWEVEVLPLKGKYLNIGAADKNPLTRKYDPDYIKNNYTLAEDAVDLAVIPGQETLTKGANIYKGRSILTPHAQIQLKQQIDEFLEKELLSDYYAAKDKDVAIADRSNDYFAQHRAEIIGWYKTRRDADELFKQKLLNAFGNAKQIPTAQRTDEYFANNRTAILQWYRPLSADNSTKKEMTEAKVDVDRLFQNVLIDQILLIDKELGDNFHALAQSLGGFNEALLMHKQTLQLPIHDPLGFDDYRPFTEAVGNTIANSNRVAPQPHNDFNPIRMGVLKILQLRLVDTFGQVQALGFKEDQVITTDAMAAPGNDHLVVLPPRLAQPARLNFRWLSADQGIAPPSESTNGNSVSSTNPNAALAVDEVEMHDHPATTPVCGWLVPNNLDSSLMVYDPQGQVLGSIDQNCQWFPAPGRFAITVAEIATINPHLHQLVAHIILQGQDFLGKFLTVVENVLDDIDPENAAQHEAIALLMARPIAVVRAKLNLEVQGLPAFDQEWNVFRQEVECELHCEAGETNHCFRQVTHPRTGAQTILRNTQNFTQVKFPIRVGEHKQLNDGLVGFWLEEGNGYKESRFYANDSKADPHASKPEHDRITYYADDPDLLQSIDSEPIVLTMLVDPRGSIHATSGILPTKSIRIPPDQYVEALRRIEVMFLSAPILSDRGSIKLNLPTEPGYAWSWVDKENGVWDTEHKIETVNPQAAFSAKQEIREGWLKLTQSSG